MEKISPTRMNLLILKERRRTAQNGLDLLRSKREALMKEFLAITERVVAGRERLRSRLREAATRLSLAVGLDGRGAVESAAMAARREIAVELKEKNVWGVRFPEFRHDPIRRASDARNYSFAGVSVRVNAAAADFEEALDLVLKILSVEMRLKKIGAEIKKTTRRINGITEVILPGLSRGIHDIGLSLDEREREEMFRIKRFKGRESGVESGE